MFAFIPCPMIESALRKDLLRSWNRICTKREYFNNEQVNDLSKLMSYHKAEVESEELIGMAVPGFYEVTCPSTSFVCLPTACYAFEIKVRKMVLLFL